MSCLTIFFFIPKKLRKNRVEWALRRFSATKTRARAFNSINLTFYKLLLKNDIVLKLEMKAQKRFVAKKMRIAHYFRLT